MADQVFAFYLIAINLFTFVLFAADKKKAVRGKWRVRERTLLGCAFFGGALGGLLAMHTFHHKTQKPKFSIGLPVMLVLQVVLLVYLNYHQILRV